MADVYDINEKKVLKSVNTPDFEGKEGFAVISPFLHCEEKYLKAIPAEGKTPAKIVEMTAQEKAAVDADAGEVIKAKEIKDASQMPHEDLCEAVVKLADAVVAGGLMKEGDLPKIVADVRVRVKEIQTPQTFEGKKKRRN